MFSRKAEERLQVQIPPAAQDRPSWMKVGVITAIGFLVGVAWPRIAGVRLGPSVPSDNASAAAAASAPPAEPGSAAPAAPAAIPVPAAIASPAPVAVAPSLPAVTVGHGVVFACKNSDGDSLKGSDCGSLPGLDGQVMARLRKLAECPDAAGASGKLHLVVHLDFSRGALSVDLGKGHGVASPDALLACAKTDVTGVGLGGVAHDNPRYSVAYSVTFDAAGGASPAQSGTAAVIATPGDTADGSAQVVWEVAIVRDAPKTGKVLARLQRGATVHVGSAKDGWYPVKFGDGFGSDGWLYRGAIGR
jgi:hypothetical protein